MHGFLVHGQVSSLGEAAPAAGDVAAECLTRLEGRGVRDLDVLAERAGSVEGARAVGTLRRVCGFDV